MPKKNLFYGANIPYTDIAIYYEQGIFSYFVFQPMIPDSDKQDDDFWVALWAVNNNGAVMNGTDPVVFKPNTHFKNAKKKIRFANAYISKSQLESLFKSGTFTLGLAPVYYQAQEEYIAYEIFNADKDLHINYTVLDTANPSPPYKSFLQ